MSLYPKAALKRIEAIEARLAPPEDTGFGVHVIDAATGVTLSRKRVGDRELVVGIDFMEGHARDEPEALPEEATLDQDSLRLKRILDGCETR